MINAPTFGENGRKKRLTPRHQRLLQALLAGPIYREQADRIAGASNSPHYIGELRRTHGLNIVTERGEHIDRDGFKTRPGIYTLQVDSIELAEMLLEQAEAEQRGES